ncbi:hypothetical protein MWU75_15055 [Ornithinimicrobium sp. F0845]|uniref:hypothetical protein n=1 Tax=Ornithinimicrobium sp. F0845 TaxID=2926412 RepID=UPI001FF36657|nr:hypothetical protein [Ornithinimicrobium sp. F0845]MCK0113465.1 hypothetical protein [Ornithinimicrobium sp. F0845]
MEQMTMERATGSPARTAHRGTVISALVGAVVGGVLWLAWQPTTQDCNTIGECLGRPIGALIGTVLALLVTLLVLRLLRVRPVFVTTVLGFAGGAALIVTLITVLDVWSDGPDGLAPWWTWVLLGGLAAALAHWVNQPGRSWPARVVPIVVVIGLVFAGLTWAESERAAQRLARFEAVGVEQVVTPQVPGYHLSSAWPGQRAEGSVDVITLNYYADAEGAHQPVTGVLIPLEGRDPCGLALSAESMTDRECDGGTEAMRLRWSGADGQVFYVGAGQVVGDTLVVLTADPETFDAEALLEAIEAATPSSVVELRDL